MPGSGSSSGNRRALCTSGPARHKQTGPSRRHHPDCDGGSVRAGEGSLEEATPQLGGTDRACPRAWYRDGRTVGTQRFRLWMRRGFIQEAGGERMRAGAPTYTNTRRRDRRDPTEGQRATAREGGGAEVTRKPSPASRALGRTPATTPGSVLGHAGGAKRPGPAGPRGSRGTASVGGG